MVRFSSTRNLWTHLRPWQKGAVIGAGFHVLAGILWSINLLIIYFLQQDYGEAYNSTRNNIGEALSWIGTIFFLIVEAIPLFLVKQFDFLINNDILNAPARKFFGISLFVIFSTGLYAVLGAALGWSTGFLQRKNPRET